MVILTDLLMVSGGLVVVISLMIFCSCCGSGGVKVGSLLMGTHHRTVVLLGRLTTLSIIVVVAYRPLLITCERRRPVSLVCLVVIAGFIDLKQRPTLNNDGAQGTHVGNLYQPADAVYRGVNSVY